MPARPLQNCTTPGCPHKTVTGRCQPCRDLRRDAKRRRRRSEQLDYYGPSWPGRRLDFLTRNPTCVLCGRLAAIPDHHPIARRFLVAAGVVDPDADEHLRPLCKPCHDRETAVNQPGGWAREKTPRHRPGPGPA